MHQGYVPRAAALIGTLIVVVAAPAEAWADELLYNGIRLPSPWPPTLEESDLESMRAPYLRSPPPVIPIDVGRQLFVDDFLIEETTLKRRWHAVEPYSGNPIVRADRPWESKGQYRDKYHGPYAIPFSDGVWYDPKDGIYKMWYMGGLLHATCYATSKDGIHWEKPSLDVEGGTNVVHPGNRDSCTIWMDLEEKDPHRRYKMFRFQKTPRRGLVLHFSADGIHWSDEIAWAGNCHDRTTVFYNPFRQVWVCSIKAWLPPEPPYKARVRRYHEGGEPARALRWAGYGDPPLWLGANRPDPRHPDRSVRAVIYNLDAVAYESLMLGLFTINQGSSDKQAGRPKRNQVFAGFSRDGFYWHRPYIEPLFGVSEKKGAWNWGNVQSAGGCCLIVDDKLHFYYSGRAGTGRLTKDESYWEADASTGLGFLRRDGFASMDADSAGGALTTRVVRFSGQHLFVNADAGGGALRAEVLDEAGQVIAPFSRDHCAPVSVDRTLQPVRWSGASDLSAVAGQPVRFRFHLTTARLYAFWVSPEPSGASQGYVAAGGPGFTGSTDTVGSAGYGRSSRVEPAVTTEPVPPSASPWDGTWRQDSSGFSSGRHQSRRNP